MAIIASKKISKLSLEMSLDLSSDSPKSETAVRLGVERSNAEGDRFGLHPWNEIGDKFKVVLVSGEGIKIYALGFSSILLRGNTSASGMKAFACGFKGVVDVVKFWQWPFNALEYWQQGLNAIAIGFNTVEKIVLTELHISNADLVESVSDLQHELALGGNGVQL